MIGRHGHIPALDGLRGIAILLVLAHNLNLIDASAGVWRAIELALDFGWIGVQLFFVLSGFLITGILLDTVHSPTYFSTFFVRRVLRIFPLYYAVLFVAFAIVPLMTTPPPGYGDQQVWLWTYLSNFAGPLGRGEAAFPHFWSLGVEEQFYLLWPLAVRVSSRRSVVFVGVVVTIVSIGLRIFVRGHFGPDAAYEFLPCRMDALAVGAIAAAAIRDDRFARIIDAVTPNMLAAVGGALLVGGSVFGKLQRTGEAMQAFGYTVLALGFGAVVLACLKPDALPARLLARASLRRIGLYSYGMYVFHSPLHHYVGIPLLGWLIPRPSAIVEFGYIVFVSAATFSLAALSFHVFERPFLRLKERVAAQSVG